ALVSFLSTVASMLRSNNQLQPLNVVVRPISRQGRVRFFFNFDSFGTIDQTSPTQRSSHAPYPTQPRNLPFLYRLRPRPLRERRSCPTCPSLEPPPMPQWRLAFHSWRNVVRSVPVTV